MNYVRRKGLALALTMLAFTAGAEVQKAPERYRITSTTDWAARRLTLTIELDIGAEGLRLPAGRLDAERMIEHDLPGILKDALIDLAVDSQRRLGDTVEDGSIDIEELLSLADAALRRDAVFSRDLATFRATYELPLLAAARLYVRHSSPTPLSSAMSFRPTKPYTGIVIYAKGPLPLHGEAGEERLRPCLFPRIFDEEMTLLLERNAVSPEALRRWGELGYTEALDGAAETRVGDEPLKIVAAGIFGTERTDLIIARDDALKILGNAANRALIAQGRVLVVLDATQETRKR